MFASARQFTGRPNYLHGRNRLRIKPQASKEHEPDLSRRRFIIAGATLSGSFLVGLPLVSMADADNVPEGSSQIGYFIIR